MELDLVIVGDQNELTAQTIETASAYLPDNIHLNVFIEPYVGYNKSLNNGARKGNAPVIGFLNNDLVFLERWFEPLLEALNTYDSVSPWCPKTHHIWWETVTPDEITPGFDVGKIVAGWAIFARRSTWTQIGGFDERLEFWCSDDSYAEQLMANQLSHALIPESKVIHLKNATLNTVSEEKRYDLTRNQAKVFNRLYDKNLLNVGKADIVPNLVSSVSDSEPDTQKS